jgi:ferritin-like metal-binding protein YciE
MTERELFISWLNDAYSTELAMMPVLENHAKDAQDYPEIHRRNLQHVAETRRQAEGVKQIIESLGGKVSTAKSITGKISGLGQSISSEFFSDELIKNFLSDYAAENLEIASYKSLIATAKHIGEDQCVPVLEEILEEEIAMARWLEEHIPMATAESIKIVTSENGAKRSKKSKGKKGVASKLLKPSTLVTLLGVGAVGAGAAMLLRGSSQNKNGGDGNTSRSLESGDGVSDNLADTSDDFKQTDVVITETLIIMDEPELSVMRDADGETF